MNRMVSEVGDSGTGVERYRIVDGIVIGMDAWVWSLGRLVLVHLQLKFVEFLFVSCE